MRLEIASAKAVRYACLNFHYAKRMPAPPCVGFSVFNSNGEWCGVIVFNNGMGGIEKPFDLQKGQVCELARVALNGKQESTGECVAIALRLFKKLNPLVKVVVSYADSDQNHTGVTYQATNWFFIGSKRTSDEYIDPQTKRSVHRMGHSNAGFKIQFGLKNNILAAADITLVLATLIWAMIAIYPYAKWVALVNIPYLLWSLFATVLQLTITYLNFK